LTIIRITINDRY